MPENGFEPRQKFTSLELRILQQLQKGLPICPAPYAEIAKSANCAEEDVLVLLKRLKDKKIIRRFGAGVNHRKAGFEHNALLAWNLGGLQAELINTLAETAAGFKFISHCYLRPSPGPDWPWSLYTMLHAGSAKELRARVDQAWQTLQEKTPRPLEKPLVLKTLEEYKKSTMNYF